MLHGKFGTKNWQRILLITDLVKKSLFCIANLTVCSDVEGHIYGARNDKFG
jgi:hypothetical protein